MPTARRPPIPPAALRDPAALDEVDLVPDEVEVEEDEVPLEPELLVLVLFVVVEPEVPAEVAVPGKLTVAFAAND